MTVSYAPTWFGHAADITTSPNPTHSLRGHVVAVEVLASHGLHAPEAWSSLRGRWAELQHAVAGGRQLLDRLTDSIIAGGGDIPTAYTLACAEQARRGNADAVIEHVQNHINVKLSELYSPVAGRHWKIIAGEFNDAATMFTACTRIVDVTAPAALAIRGEKKTQEAWHQAEAHAQTLDSLVDVLAAAAELARRPDQGSEIGGDRVSFLLPLCVDVKGLHRRQVWHAFRDEDVPEPGPLTRQALSAPAEPEAVRCGRWGRLARLHAKISASNPAELQLFPPPKPRGVKFDRQGRSHPFDPEDLPGNDEPLSEEQ
jgi:hypothetical protein